MDKNLTPEEIEGIRDTLRQITKDANVLPPDKYREGLLSGVPVVCGRWNDYSAEHARQVWRTEPFRKVHRRECKVCGCEIVIAEINKEATFPICIDCFMEHHAALTKEANETVAGRPEAGASGVDQSEDSGGSDPDPVVGTSDGSVSGS